MVNEMIGRNTKMFLIFTFVFCIGIFMLPNAHAGPFGLEDNSKGMLNGGSVVTGALQTTGLMAANFIVPSLVTSLVAGGNKMSEATGGMSSGIGTAGALLGGAIFGSMGGMIGGAIGALAGGIAGAINMNKILFSVDRGIVTRVISLDMKNAKIYDADYKIKGSDSESAKFTTNFDKDRQFLKKEKGVQYQYTPVMIKNSTIQSRSAIRAPVETAVLQVETYGLPEYSNTSVANPNAATGTNMYANNQYGQQQYGMQQSTYVGQQDPYADAFPLGKNATQSLGWCEVNNQGKLTGLDKTVSDKFVLEEAETRKKQSTEAFVLLLKNLNAQDEEIKIPAFNCFGPDGLTGVTGAQYKPKVEFKWQWYTVGQSDYCSKDLNDEKRVYCDSTQFMESLFKRIQESSNELMNLKDQTFTSTSDMNISDNTNKIYNLLNFRASLMKDGYTLDFLNDFKEYVTQTTYLGFPDAQKNLASTMLPSKIIFRPLSGSSMSPEGYKLQYAGYYNVTIEVVYNSPGDYRLIDEHWNLESNVKQIIVYFEPISQENNPVYYMPLDATVGVTNGIIDRVGYGVDYSGDSVWFSKNQNEGILLEPTLRSNSTPIVSLVMTNISDVATINGPMRGTVLQIIPKSTSVGASYSVNRFLSLPAYADMTINKKSDDGAYAFYTVDFGLGPETAGNSFIRWSLICDKDAKTFDCESFSGLKATDEMYIPDVIGAKAKVAPTGQLQGKVYGLEWASDSILRDGKHTSAMYRGLVYMPDITGASSLRLTNVIASDSMTITNTPPSEFAKISDIQNIYDLMEKDAICMSNENGGVGVRFWWNPAKVMGLDTT